MSWPNDVKLFIGLGAMKAGTTWLYEYLKKNPEVHFSDLKEVHYFDVLNYSHDRHHFISKIDRLHSFLDSIKNKNISSLSEAVGNFDRVFNEIRMYKNSDGKHREYKEFLLENYNDQKVIGDITPSYCFASQSVISDMLALSNDVRFIFIMRDPIDRLWSAVRMRAKQQTELNFDDSCKLIVNELMNNSSHPMLTRSDYIRTLENVEKVVPADKFLYVFYEEMFSSRVCKEISSFLDIPYLEPSFKSSVNKGEALTLDHDTYSKLYSVLEPQYIYLRNKLGASIPAAWH